MSNSGGRYEKFKLDRVSADEIDGADYYEKERAMWIPCGEGTDAWDLDSSNGAAAAQLGTAGQSQISVLNFDGYSSDSDDIAYLHLVVPTDYKVDSMRIDLVWTHTDSDNGTETVTWIATANAVQPNASTLEAFDAAGTSITATLTKALTATSAGKVYKNTLNPEVEDIAAGDLLTIKLTLDASETAIDSGEHVQLIGALIRWDAVEQ